MNRKSRYTWVVPVLLALISLSGCQQGPQSCPSYRYLSLESPENFASDAGLPFQFPLEDPESYTQPVMTNFAICGRVAETRWECHAAEDYLGDPGTPVYAMADGEVSFSGPLGGYGWLIIIDHPQYNLYSLYGHLSPSRWQTEPGAVAKGDLIGYLGDPDENGGSVEQPLVPHLHFGIRAGQRTDYPGQGEWRWMAGWIAVCPQDAGWLQPSVVIAGQQTPEGGFQQPSGNFFAIWWFPIFFGAIFLLGWVCVLVYASRKNNPRVLSAISVLYLTAGWISYGKSFRLSWVLFTLAAASISIGIYQSVKRKQSGESKAKIP